MQESSRGADLTARTYVSTCLCMQADHCKHVRTFLIGYRSAGTPCVFISRGVCWNCGPSTREQCLPVPRQPPGSSCCLSLLAGGFRPTTACWLGVENNRLQSSKFASKVSCVGPIQ